MSERSSSNIPILSYFKSEKSFESSFIQFLSFWTQIIRKWLCRRLEFLYFKPILGFCQNKSKNTKIYRKFASISLTNVYVSAKISLFGILNNKEDQ